MKVSQYSYIKRVIASMLLYSIVFSLVPFSVHAALPPDANRIARLNTDGTIDTSFHIGSGFNNTVYDTVVQPDGKIVVVGDFTNYNGTPINRVARLNTDGSLDTSFVVGSGFQGSSGYGATEAGAVVLQPDGKIVVGGRFATYQGISSVGIARLNPNGSIDTGFLVGTGFGCPGMVLHVRLQPDGKILAGGWSGCYNGVSTNYGATRLNADGTLDTSMAHVVGYSDNS
jgi:uncharacterized delta-60 repeat protein